MLVPTTSCVTIAVACGDSSSSTFTSTFLDTHDLLPSVVEFLGGDLHALVSCGAVCKMLRAAAILTFTATRPLVNLKQPQYFPWQSIHSDAVPAMIALLPDGSVAVSESKTDGLTGRLIVNWPSTAMGQASWMPLENAPGVEQPSGLVAVEGRAAARAISGRAFSLFVCDAVSGESNG